MSVGTSPPQHSRQPHTKQLPSTLSLHKAACGPCQFRWPTPARTSSIQSQSPELSLLVPLLQKPLVAHTWSGSDHSQEVLAAGGMESTGSVGGARDDNEVPVGDLGDRSSQLALVDLTTEAPAHKWQRLVSSREPWPLFTSPVSASAAMANRIRDSAEQRSVERRRCLVGLASLALLKELADAEEDLQGAAALSDASPGGKGHSDRDLQPPPDSKTSKYRPTVSFPHIIQPTRQPNRGENGPPPISTVLPRALRPAAWHFSTLMAVSSSVSPYLCHQAQGRVAEVGSGSHQHQRSMGRGT